jgi:hypothetical protein
MHPNDGRDVSNFIVQALLGQGITIYGDGSQTRSFCYVDDLTDGLVRLRATPDSITGPININPNEFSILELASIVIELRARACALCIARCPTTILNSAGYFKSERLAFLVATYSTACEVRSYDRLLRPNAQAIGRRGRQSQHLSSHQTVAQFFAPTKMLSIRFEWAVCGDPLIVSSMGSRKRKARTAYSEVGGAAAPVTIKDLADLLCARAPGKHVPT